MFFRSANFSFKSSKLYANINNKFKISLNKSKSDVISRFNYSTLNNKFNVKSLLSKVSLNKNYLGNLLITLDIPNNIQSQDLNSGILSSKGFSTTNTKKDSKKKVNEDNETNESSEGQEPEAKEKKVNTKNNKSESSESSSSESSDEFEDSKVKAKYKNLMDLYHDQAGKIEFTRSKYEELREAYIVKKGEVENIKQRVEKEKLAAKEFAITKFAKDLLDVSDNFQRAFTSIKDIDYKSLSEEEKVKTFKDFTEGKLNKII